MNIGEASKASKVSAKMIRYYEQIGLIPPADRTESGYRTYTQADIHRLHFIRRARDLGFSIDRVRNLLGLSDQRDRTCGAIEMIAREHLVEVERKIKDLQALRRELDSILSGCERGIVAEYRLIEALAPSDSIGSS